MRDFPRTVFSYSKVSLQTGVFRHLALLGRFTRQTFILCVCHRTKYMPTAKSLRVGRLLPSASMAAVLPARVGETRPLLLLLAPGGPPSPWPRAQPRLRRWFRPRSSSGAWRRAGSGARGEGSARPGSSGGLSGWSFATPSTAGSGSGTRPGGQQGWLQAEGWGDTESIHPVQALPNSCPTSTPFTRDATLTPKQFGVLRRPSL